MPGIQEAFSWNWKPEAARSKRNHRGRLTRNPTAPVMFATQRTASSFLPKNGKRSRIAAPTRGVKVMTERRCPPKRSMRSSSVSQDEPAPDADHEQDDDQHRERVVLH